MIYLEPINQIKLFGLERFFNEFVTLLKENRLPNKILLSGQKGLGKSTLAYHFINYALTLDEEFRYNLKELSINPENRTFKTLNNKSNPNFYLIDLEIEKKTIDINQVRELIIKLNKSSFNLKPRFILIDNLELLNLNSVNALLKILEEPPENTYFILINNNKKILETLSSRCINFKIYLSNEENIKIANKLLNGKLNELINDDLIDYYITPGRLYNLLKFSEINKYDLINLDLKKFLKIIIKHGHYKKDKFMNLIIFDLIQLYFTKINLSISRNYNDNYNYFLKRISETKKFNLDEESLLNEFRDKVLNG